MCFPELGPVAGKGDNLWRGLTAARGDIVCFVDADTTDFGPHFVHRLVEPLLKPGIEYVKGSYRRPWRDGDDVQATGGGRVTTLLARPLLRRFYPELAWLQQPLAGEMAARRSLFESVPFTTGYGLEIGLLIDIYRRVGAQAIRQADLHTRQNRHRPLEELGPMSDAILESVTVRLAEEGRLTRRPATRRERPPLTQIRARRLDSRAVTWEPELEELRRREELARRMGGEERVARQHADGPADRPRARRAALRRRHLPRDRARSPARATYDEHGELTDFLPANMVVGQGRIDGRRAVLQGDDFTVRGGAADAAIWQKMVFAEQMAHDMRLPLVRLVDGTGGGGSVKHLETMGFTYVPFVPGWELVVENLSVVPGRGGGARARSPGWARRALLRRTSP